MVGNASMEKLVASYPAGFMTGHRSHDRRRCMPMTCAVAAAVEGGIVAYGTSDVLEEVWKVSYHRLSGNVPALAAKISEKLLARIDLLVPL